MRDVLSPHGNRESRFGSSEHRRRSTRSDRLCENTFCVSDCQRSGTPAPELVPWSSRNAGTCRSGTLIRNALVRSESRARKPVPHNSEGWFASRRVTLHLFGARSPCRGQAFRFLGSCPELARECVATGARSRNLVPSCFGMHAAEWLRGASASPSSRTAWPKLTVRTVTPPVSTLPHTHEVLRQRRSSRPGRPMRS